MLSVFPIHLLSLLSSLLFYLPYSYGAPTDVPSAASFYISHLPDLHQDETRPLRMYGGHLSSDPDAGVASPTDVTAHLYFFMVKARRTADKERIIFWLNGGPGCSSFDGLMMEIGPWRIDENGGLQTKVGGWEEYATVVFVDQPAGTGFSYAPSNKYDHELPEASAHFVEFLKNFYHVFPEYQDVDAYITGESFAGQYIPYFADAVLNSNLKIPLKGAAIGNGWTDARRQYPSYLDYALKHGILEEGSSTHKAAKEVTDRCMDELKHIDGEPVHVDICENVMMTVISGKANKKAGVEMCLNIYDVRLEDTSPQCGMNWPPDLDAVYKYLARRDVVSAIHADQVPGKWVECKSRVHSEFTTRSSNSSITVLPRVLEKIPVMLFVGDQDLICNYVGIESMIQAMTWNGETGLGKVQTQSWTVGGNPAGTWVASRNLTYVKIFDASHMVGFDAPDVVHDMILRFMGVNFTAITDGSARIPSSVGDDSKPLPAILDEVPTSSPVSTKTPEQDKAMWEAYYNAGSAALVLVLIALVVVGFLWWRSRGKRSRGLSLSTHEEHIPLNSSMADEANGSRDDGFRPRKGKERADSLPEDVTIFDVGDDEDEERSPRPRS
ncbi:alpha/beta-hydrolase [Lentinus tigrinus ALCF2SS1-7]|uniref:Pheromone-processing carboxypeptidase KEX1 n=1 Tax=Lentinus tigrinus ALCF2SS1-6 TaxID=1328759 RepID=A0A5C2STU0_9APHY|nr:alpha/beta-hydrolase [Lentinus tigrinus ALCF2SS1-6]RPD80819.1 alpha/beta-hydrolase [Lentinus tigrinus ALCF2SS1-7]